MIAKKASRSVTVAVFLFSASCWKENEYEYDRLSVELYIAGVNVFARLRGW